jgi:hypothetical protein
MYFGSQLCSILWTCTLGGRDIATMAMRGQLMRAVCINDCDVATAGGKEDEPSLARSTLQPTALTHRRVLTESRLLGGPGRRVDVTMRSISSYSSASSEYSPCLLRFWMVSSLAICTYPCITMLLKASCAPCSPTNIYLCSFWCLHCAGC